MPVNESVTQNCEPYNTHTHAHTHAHTHTHTHTCTCTCIYVYICIVDLQDLLDIRHCVFTLGDSGANKSEAWKTLARAWSKGGVRGKTSTRDLNPKARPDPNPNPDPDPNV